MSTHPSYIISYNLSHISLSLFPSASEDTWVLGHAEGGGRHIFDAKFRYVFLKSTILCEKTKRCANVALNISYLARVLAQYIQDVVEDRSWGLELEDDCLPECERGWSRCSAYASLTWTKGFERRVRELKGGETRKWQRAIRKNSTTRPTNK